MRDMIRNSSVLGFFIMMIVVVTCIGWCRDIALIGVVSQENDPQVQAILQEMERSKRSAEGGSSGELRRVTMGGEPARSEPNLPLIAAGVGGAVVLVLGALGTLLFLRREADEDPQEATSSAPSDDQVWVDIPKGPGPDGPPGTGS